MNQSPAGAAIEHLIGLQAQDPNPPYLSLWSRLRGFTKDELTGLLNDALSSSHFAIAGKLTGHDAIVVRGACDEPSALLVDRDGARLAVEQRVRAGVLEQGTVDLLVESGAGERLRREAIVRDADAEERLRARLGKGWRIASIGPAGERLVSYATVSHDGRHAGRGGLGAVMGAKNLKAVAVRAATKVAPADHDIEAGGDRIAAVSAPLRRVARRRGAQRQGGLHDGVSERGSMSANVGSKSVL